MANPSHVFWSIDHWGGEIAREVLLVQHRSGVRRLDFMQLLLCEAGYLGAVREGWEIYTLCECVGVFW